MSHMKQLVNLNLSHNKITVIHGLEGCDSLKTLDISHNFIAKITDCEELKVLPSLTSLDMRDNHIADKDELVPFFAEMKFILALYLKGNPAMRLISNYRRQLTGCIPTLYYLDERPILEFERLMVDANIRGGKEEEERVRAEWAEKTNARTKQNTQFGVKLSEEAKIKRKATFKKMMADIQGER